MLLKSPAARWTPKAVPRQKTTSAAAVHRILKPIRMPNPASRWKTMEIQTATSGIGTWTFAKYFAVPLGSRSWRMPSQMKRPDISKRASGGKQAFKVCMARRSQLLVRNGHRIGSNQHGVKALSNVYFDQQQASPRSLLHFRLAINYGHAQERSG